MSEAGLFLILALAAVVYISAWFVFGFLYLNRIDSVDSAWGLGFVYLGAVALISKENYHLFPVLGFMLVTIWGLRLFTHITTRNVKKPEDSRYKVYREKFASNLNFLIYTRIFLVQGALILIISTASLAVISGKDFNTPLAWAGLVVWAAGIIFESVADAQLRTFLAAKKGGIMKQGLWRYSRHPNYFGEITAWTGAAITACAAGRYWGIIGPLSIAYLIIKVSGLPPIEKRYADDREYQKYKKTTSALVPLPPKR